MKGARKEERGHSAETPEENTKRIVMCSTLRTGNGW